MKFPKIYIVIPIIILIGIVVFLVFRGDSAISFFGKKAPSNTEEMEKSVEISQKQMSALVFGTKKTESENVVHIIIQSYLNMTILDPELEVKSFKLTNFKGSSKAGNLILVHPTDYTINTAGRSFLYTDMTTELKNDDVLNYKSGGNTISYNVVSEPGKYNEVRKDSYLMPNFSILIRNLGTVDVESILERDSVFDGSKYLQYLGLTPSDLETSFQFDIVVEFENGKSYSKRFVGNLDTEGLTKEYSITFDLQTL